MAKMTFQLVDCTDEVLRKLRKQIQRGFKSVGQEAEGFAKKECPVDTGRLRNSIAWATVEAHGSKKMSGDKGKDGDSKPQGIPEEECVYVGTNVEYAVYVEYCNYEHKKGTKRHFLRDALANHGDRFKEIMQAALDAM